MKRFTLPLILFVLLASLSACASDEREQIPTPIPMYTQSAPMVISPLQSSQLAQQPAATPTSPETAAAPTEVPTLVSTEAPTETPTEAPTEIPTEVPTETPTVVPTESPTMVPTEATTPTVEPTVSRAAETEASEPVTATATLTATEPITETAPLEAEATPVAEPSTETAPAAAADATVPAELPAEMVAALAAGDAGRGEQLILMNGCTACHSMQEGVIQVGPSWYNLAGHAETRMPGVSAEAYLYDSIIHPNNFLVEGFQPNLMPQLYEMTLTREQLADIIAYLLTLRGEE